jgi:hypothetical protein
MQRRVTGMFQHVTRVKPMFLSPQEAMDLLDLCVISQVETDPDKELVILKLTEFVRQCILEEQNARSESVRRVETSGPKPSDHLPVPPHVPLMARRQVPIYQHDHIDSCQ